MGRLKLKLVFTILIVFYSVFASAFSYAELSGRNTIRSNNSGVIIVAKATRLAAKSHAIKRYGRNIKILSNRLSRSVSSKKLGSKKYICRKVVLKTKYGERKTIRVCSKNV
ncbi:MAG TPA: hypothetical protein ENJ51_06290 [Leucothrix mucor]|uniref:Uncharacterized protein n=1 Tax=Leucothrix mucor TaxID=45248 RepID=A0A7V2WV25_LEUMU|nr:hypothetical protein [Leucothrix mucor]